MAQQLYLRHCGGGVRRDCGLPVHHLWGRWGNDWRLRGWRIGRRGGLLRLRELLELFRQDVQFAVLGPKYLLAGLDGLECLDGFLLGQDFLGCL